jgi:hypothetical protein
VAEGGDAAAPLPEGLVDALGRIADVMALTLVRRMEKPEKMRVLSSLGYTHAEIAAFLEEKTNTVSKALSRQKAAPAGRKSTARKKTAARKRPAARRRRR